MALSNLRREPRREIIEQIVGVTLFVGVMTVDYAFVSWLGPQTKGDLILGMIGVPLVGGALGFIAIMFLTHGIHLIGEFGCAILAAVGADPRPKQRR